MKMFIVSNENKALCNYQIFELGIKRRMANQN